MENTRVCYKLIGPYIAVPATVWFADLVDANVVYRVSTKVKKRVGDKLKSNVVLEVDRSVRNEVLLYETI